MPGPVSKKEPWRSQVGTLIKSIDSMSLVTYGQAGTGSRCRFSYDEMWHVLVEKRFVAQAQSTTKDDLDLVTNAPGPPTIQPGIPELQPSVPASGVASLNIPPAHQTSPSISSQSSPASTATSDPLSSTTVLPLVPTPPAVTANPVIVSSSTATSIPFLSDLLSQLFSRSSSSTGSSTLIESLAPTAIAVQLSETDKSSISGESPHMAPSPTVVSDPKDLDTTQSMASTLIYSLTLPPYSGGLDSSGIAETMTVSSTGNVKTDLPSATTYSFSLPPYTPKVPTYVATSAVTAPLSLTSAAVGTPSAGAPTTRIFLEQGVVDPIKDLPSPTAIPIIPVYSPACLGNAYGGGYVITPTAFVANPNATGIAMIPPAYGFSYKLEPTPSPAYSAAVIEVDTKATILVATSAPLGLSTPGGVGPSTLGCAQCLAATGKDMSASPSASIIPFKDLVPASTGDLPVSRSSIFHQEAGTSIKLMSIVQLPSITIATGSNSGSALTTDANPDTYIGPSASDTSFVTSDLENISAAGVQNLTTRISSVVATVTVNVNCSTSTSAAESSIAASNIAPNQVHRAAGLSDVTVTNTGSTLETDYLRSEINRTFTLSGNGSEFAAFEGGTWKLTPSVLAFPIAITFVYCAVNIF
ncbi:MAG: hypothetical protein Q9220_004887 [cf. Caloplaca sp. 1 TL-2023]